MGPLTFRNFRSVVCETSYLHSSHTLGYSKEFLGILYYIQFFYYYHCKFIECYIWPFSVFLDRLTYIEWQGRYICVAIMLCGPNIRRFDHKVFNFLIFVALEKAKNQKYKTQTNRKQFRTKDKLFQPPPKQVLVAGRVRNF